MSLRVASQTVARWAGAIPMLACVVGLASLAPAPATAQTSTGSPASAAPSTPATIDETRTAVGKWVATQELIFKERKAWDQERELLLSRVDLVQKEIAELEQKLSATRQTLGAERARRAEAEGSSRNLELAIAGLAERLSGYEAKVQALYKVLPESTREKVEPLHRRIPQDPATTKVTVAERFQNVLGILNEVNRINGEVTLATEIRPLSDGQPSEVKTVYIGLAQAYFISARGEAGIGRPTADGWLWEARNDLARDVNIVIQMLQNTAKPSFVPLPVTIQ